LVHVFVDGGIARRAEIAQHEQDLVALDQFAGLLDGFWRTVAVVV
jgi:hypothetical protein